MKVYHLVKDKIKTYCGRDLEMVFLTFIVDKEDICKPCRKAYLAENKI